MRKNKEVKWKIVFSVVVAIIVLVALLIHPVQILIVKNNISKQVKCSILKDIEYENYTIEGKYYNVLNIRMKDEFDDYDYSKKKSISTNVLEMFTKEYKKYEDVLIDKTSKNYINDIVKKETDAKVILNCKENKYTIFGGFSKNDEEYTEEDSLKELISLQLKNCENEEELITIVNDNNYTKETLKNIINIHDIKEKSKEIIYSAAISNKDKYQKEIELLEKIPEYKDSKNLIDSIKKEHELDGEWYGNYGITGFDWIINGNICYNVYSNSLYKYTYDKYNCKYENNILYVFNNTDKMDDLDRALFKMNYIDGKIVYSPYSSTNTVTLSKKSDNTIPNDIVKLKTPSIGMSKKDVEESTWGKPEKINRTETIYGIREQWCYSRYRYIYFENGIVTSIQN
ncbi:putative uncharacterized protein [Clostridium sp. CAG:470]|nr:MAG: hypothetical protein BHW03_01445 [Clostridium sp. 28_17]CDE14937.1 putative uncharacterized protein [Clostridium sp. CAG:470]